MKLTSNNQLIYFLLIISVFATVTSSIAQEDRLMGGGVGITVFKDKDFRGASATFRNAVPDLSQTDFNDRISSIRVGGNEQWEVCEHAEFRGRCVVISGEEGDLSRNDWNDKISSVRRVRGGAGGYPGPGPANDYIVLFEQPNYRGDPTNYDRPTNNLFGKNRRARSVTVAGGTWELCDGLGFSGRCVTLNRSTPNLDSFGMSRRVMSVRPVRGGYPPSTNDWYIVIYDQVNYRGDPTNYNSSRDNINKRARSITIGQGVWEICDGRNFTGRCEIISQSTSDLRRLNLGETIRSVRPVTRQPR